jgi:hypothetical protein
MPEFVAKTYTLQQPTHTAAQELADRGTTMPPHSTDPARAAAVTGAAAANRGRSALIFSSGQNYGTAPALELMGGSRV